MTDSHRKRKYAGPTIQERRKLDQDPAKHGSKPKPREYGLVTYEQRLYVHKRTAWYPTSKAREQAMAAARKQAAAATASRFNQRWYDKYEVTVTFQELDA
jgi:hypothetical protein